MSEMAATRLRCQLVQLCSTSLRRSTLTWCAISDGIPYVAHRQSETQLTPFGRGAFGAVQAASQDVKLGFRHSAFQAEQQPIVELAQVVRAIGIDDQRVGQAGQF